MQVCVTYWWRRVCTSSSELFIFRWLFEFVTFRWLTATLQHTATHCNILQHTATRCNTMQHNAIHRYTLQHTTTHCNTLQYIATHCNTLQHTCNTLRLTATHCNTLLHTATHCNTLQYTATHCNTLQHTALIKMECVSVWCVGGGECTQVHLGSWYPDVSSSSWHAHDLLQHIATHCNTLQHNVKLWSVRVGGCGRAHWSCYIQMTRRVRNIRMTHCNTLQRTATHCNALQHTATHCNTLQHTATHCNTTQKDDLLVGRAHWSC